MISLSWSSNCLWWALTFWLCLRFWISLFLHLNLLRINWLFFLFNRFLFLFNGFFFLFNGFFLRLSFLFLGWLRSCLSLNIFLLLWWNFGCFLHFSFLCCYRLWLRCSGYWFIFNRFFNLSNRGWFLCFFFSCCLGSLRWRSSFLGFSFCGRG